MEQVHERLAAFFNLVTLAGLGSFTVLGERLSPMGAFGPCVACERADYLAVGGHRSARDTVIEGVPLGRAFLGAGFPVRNVGGRGVLSFRMYPRGFAEMARGFARSFATGSRAVAPWLLISIVVWMAGGIAATRHLIGAAAGSGEPILRWLALDALYVLQLRWMLGRIGNFGWWPALFFQIPLAFFMAVFSVSLLQTFGRRRVRWKGREVRVAPR
jgi:4,4'-diaponeurosporenoate glycosyltransferase